MREETRTVLRLQLHTDTMVNVDAEDDSKKTGLPSTEADKMHICPGKFKVCRKN